MRCDNVTVVVCPSMLVLQGVRLVRKLQSRYCENCLGLVLVVDSFHPSLDTLRSLPIRGERGQYRIVSFLVLLRYFSFVTFCRRVELTIFDPEAPRSVPSKGCAFGVHESVLLEVCENGRGFE